MKLIAARYIYIYIYNTYIFIYIGRDVIPLCLQNSFAKELFNLLYHEMKFLKKKAMLCNSLLCGLLTSLTQISVVLINI